MKAKLIKQKKGYALLNEDCTQPIASTKSPNEGHKISLKNCQAIERGYDLDELADEVFEKRPKEIPYVDEYDFKQGVMVGFQKAISILGDKKFNEKDMIMFGLFCRNNHISECLSVTDELFPKYQSLQQTEWDVIVEMDRIPADRAPEGWEVFPKVRYRWLFNFKTKTMKNLHLISTDKPSRLFNCFGKLEIGDYTTIRENLQVTNQHIYITSDEEIKEGDWFLKDGKTINKRGNIKHYAISEPKIILTTDQDLIKDGVQAIDDEFLQWFVNNPSCEEVKIKRDFADEGIKGITYYGKYFLIIPKEEPKQFVECKCTNSLQAENCIRNCGHGKEPKQETHICKYCNAETTQSDDECYAKPKQQTLEEAAKRLHPEEWDWREREIFISGAKWQQERMYSEEEVTQLLIKFNQEIQEVEDVREWFEQFKKK